MHSTASNNSSTPRFTQVDSSHFLAPSNLVTARECAIALGVPKSSLYRVRVGLPAYRIGQRGRGLRFDVAEVRAALKALTQQGVTK